MALMACYLECIWDPKHLPIIFYLDNIRGGGTHPQTLERHDGQNSNT